MVEMREKPELEIGDKLQVCQPGPFFGQEAIITKAGRKVECKVGGMLVLLKMSDVALPNAKVQPEQAKKQGPIGTKNSRAVDRAIAAEGYQPKPQKVVPACNLEEAKSKVRDKISMSIVANMMVICVLHGYGEKGILRTKLRNWLKTEGQLVKKCRPADQSDGGDSFTKIDLK